MPDRNCDELNLLDRDWDDCISRLRKEGRFGSISLFRRASLAQGNPAVLLVGKATNGWKDEDDPNCFLTKDLRDYHLSGCHHLKGSDGKPYPSQFWRFATDLAKVFAGDGECPFNQLAWTNLAKIAPTCCGNAGVRLFREQRDLAIQTLRAEIDYYQPKIVMFTTCGYMDEAVHELLGPEPLELLNEYDRFRRATSLRGFPAILWTRHPQGKRRELTNSWLEKARQLGGRTR